MSHGGDGAYNCQANRTYRRVRHWGFYRIEPEFPRVDKQWPSVPFAEDVAAERGEEGVERVRELTGGHGTHRVLECVGFLPALETAFGVARDGGAVSRVGVPSTPTSRSASKCSPATSPSPVVRPPPGLTSMSSCPTCSRAALSPAGCSTAPVGLDEVPDGYRTMDQREALKVLVRP